MSTGSGARLGVDGEEDVGTVLEGVDDKHGVDNALMPVGRDSVSATTFCSPATCRMSVVNSEINDKCRVCLGDRSADDVMAPHNGL